MQVKVEVLGDPRHAQGLNELQRWLGRRMMRRVSCAVGRLLFVPCCAVIIHGASNFTIFFATWSMLTLTVSRVFSHVSDLDIHTQTLCSSRSPSLNMLFISPCPLPFSFSADNLRRRSASSAPPLVACAPRTCRVCKKKFYPSSNTPTSCRFHTSLWMGAENSKHFGRIAEHVPSGVTYFYDCCDAEDKDHPGCTFDFHKTYDE